MARLNFFCDTDALNFLIGSDFPEDQPEVDISVDFTDAPYWFIFSSDKESWHLRTIRRGEIFLHDESMAMGLAQLTVNKETGEGEGWTSDPVLSENTGLFFQACRNLAKYAAANGLADEFGDMDPEEAGRRRPRCLRLPGRTGNRGRARCWGRAC